MAGCSHSNAVDPSSLTFLIESNPTNLDPRIDALVDQIRTETDHEKRKTLCSEVQKILADDLPYLPLWFTDVVSVHRRSLGDPALSPTGDFDSLAPLSNNRESIPAMRALNNAATAFADFKINRPFYS